MSERDGFFDGAALGAQAIIMRPARRAGTTWSRFAQDKVGLAGAFMLLIVLVVAVCAPWIAPSDPKAQNLSTTLLRPSSERVLGTDVLGRDVFSRVLFGTRAAVAVGVASALLSCVVGIIVGTIAGAGGRLGDGVLMRTVDVFLAFPILVGAIVIGVVTGSGMWSVIVAIAVFSWAINARMMRGQVLAVRDQPFVDAARVANVNWWRIVVRHIVPNAVSPVITLGAYGVGFAILAEAGLSFLGLGSPPGTPSWGRMIADGRSYFGYMDHLWIAPSLALVWTVLAFVFVAEGIRDALDPRLR